MLGVSQTEAQGPPVVLGLVIGAGMALEFFASTLTLEVHCINGDLTPLYGHAAAAVGLSLLAGGLVARRSSGR